MIRTRLTSQYGLQVPFVSAGMAFLAQPPLAAAVSNAGGLGMLALGGAPPVLLREAIRATRQMTIAPFGVDFIIETTPAGPLTTDKHVDVCIDERVPVVVFFWNLPSQEWVNRLHDAGTKVWLQAGSVERARQAVDLGIDAIIAQGSEAGGHNQGSAALFTLLPAICDALPVPVIAAGGIADGRGVAAALVLGAEGVWVGTRLVASVEAHAHAEYKRRVIEAGEGDIACTCIFGPEWPDGRMRVVRNRVVADWEGRDTKTPPPPDPPEFIGTTMLGPLEYRMPKFSSILPTPETIGDFDEMCLAAGESAGLVHEIKPAGHIVAEMMAEAEAIILRGARSLDPAAPPSALEDSSRQERPASAPA
ncbi:MAG TPA: nitronate monooxygenase [Bryobacteraceae bacterium]|nr:nitronate monooxygenase [Bryobacteraceae bacterium]